MNKPYFITAQIKCGPKIFQVFQDVHLTSLRGKKKIQAEYRKQLLATLPSWKSIVKIAVREGFCQKGLTPSTN